MKKVAKVVFVLFVVIGLPVGAFLYGFGGGDLQFIENIFTSKATKKERTITKCEAEGFNEAKRNLQTKVNILKEKENPAPPDLEKIEKYESVLNNNAVLREDSEYYYKRCMDRYGY